MMKKISLLSIILLAGFHLSGQDPLSERSPSFDTYLNPVIPGDHPDPTLTRIGNFYYTSGSSFNPTPRIYRSTDLIHWEVIAQPVSASWNIYGDQPGGGIWGGHMVFYHDKYWHFFGRGGERMYFVTADQPEGPWSNPTTMQIPAGVPGLGVDNSIFIDDETGRWYLLTKAGPENNHIVELGEDGQPNGVVLDLTWLNPDAEGNPYGWAEGPVMWKKDGHYYYSFAQHLVGEQYVMRSDTLTDDQAAWTIREGTIFTGSRATFNTPNHIAPVITLDDGTSWTFAQSYHNSNLWYAQGRQGVLCQVSYDEEGFPVIQYPPSTPVAAPDLPGNHLPWTVAKADLFNTVNLKPDWSFLGFTPENKYSLSLKDGWLYLEPYLGNNTIIQIDGEHHYSLITRVDFEPGSESDQAGLWIINGPETHQVKVYSSVNSGGEPVLGFSFEDETFEVDNAIGNIVWLKLVRDQHTMTAYYSADGLTWISIGEEINALDLDISQSQFNNFTGSQQGLYVIGNPAFFDLYIYRDAYTPVPARDPANASGVKSVSTYLMGIENDDWAMYPGVTFGNSDYPRAPVSIHLEAASDKSGVAEVWIDSIGTGLKVAECAIENTGSLSTYQVFSADVDSISGTHDVYLRFKGTEQEELFRLKSFMFLDPSSPTTMRGEPHVSETGAPFSLKQNVPNPFKGITEFHYSVGQNDHISLKVYDLTGKEVTTLFEGYKINGDYSAPFDASGLPGGIYFCRLEATRFIETRKLILLD
ncbi:MAG: family 43 glycosylhydrolase [Bacteroidota bacterium]